MGGDSEHELKSAARADTAGDDEAGDQQAQLVTGLTTSRSRGALLWAGGAIPAAVAVLLTAPGLMIFVIAGPSKSSATLVIAGDCALSLSPLMA